MKKDSVQISMKGIVDQEKETLFLSVFSDDFYNIIKDVNINAENNKTVCFTGNRPVSLPWGFNNNCKLYYEFINRTSELLKTLIKIGYNKFISGMALGFDIIMAEVVLKLKLKYNIFLECVLPCYNQTKGWKNDDVLKYKNIIALADKVVYSSSTEYFNGCYQIRNKYMVDNSDLVLGCQMKLSKGTKSTLDYAKKKNKNIIVLKK